MSARPKASNGDTLSDGSWNIHDAEAFRVGNSKTVHAVKSFPSSATVTGKCGVVGRTAYDEGSNREAVWAGIWEDADYCPTCKAR